MKRLLLLAPFTLTALAAPASAGGGSCHTGLPAAVDSVTTVTIDHACFFPEAARVAVGAKVTWHNTSGLPHNISGPAIDFTELPDGAKHTVTFGKAGLFPYACTIHPGMSGVVVVGAADVPAESAAAVQPVADTTPADGGGTSYLPWVLAGAGVLVAAGVVLTFARREGRVPVPAR